jgi:hypothetical protein
MSNQKHEQTAAGFVGSISGINKTLIVYEDKVVLEAEKAGLGASLMGLSQGQKTFIYESISSIEFKEATLTTNGYIHFNVQGDSGTNSVAGIGKILMNYQNDNRFDYSQRKLNEAALKAKNYIESSMIKVKRMPQAVVNTLSAADELRKFKQLLDDGIINQAEFDEKKKQLL